MSELPTLSLVQRAQFLRALCDTTANPSRAPIEVLKKGVVYFALPSDNDIPLTIFIRESLRK